jgi:hypothetical protein
MITTLIATPDPEPRPEPRPSISWGGSAGLTGSTVTTFTWSAIGQPPTDRDPWLIVVASFNPPRSTP